MATWDSRANELFLGALDRPPAERGAFLDSSCADDPVVRARVEALLAAEENARDFLARPALVRAVADERPGPTLLGPYKLLQKIGEGGMGEVWMAEQAEPVHRTVAVKVIRGGPESNQVVARFEAERQALALMDHPNIAKVLDAGSTPDGRLFLVMELLRAVPITAFCDDRRLSVRDRLELFVQVCRAVQHAHQKGVIHRDLKPSNVLVALYDSRPVPKVIDFGLAKATGQRLTDKTLFTEFGTVVGTLEYMSPEQAELNQLDVDTRTDVYSLGVLLFELLTGTTPLDPPRLGTVPILEVLRQVREGDTPRPSTRLSTSIALPTIAAARGVDPRHLTGLLKGELDWITMTALEKDRERRYESAAALAADVERYLRDEAVQACPPSVWYRARKFARKYRRGLVAAGAVGLVTVLAVSAAAGAIGWAIRDVESRRAKEAADARTAAAAELDKADLLLAARKRPDAESAWARAARHLEAAPDEALSARLAETRQKLEAAKRDDEFLAAYEALLLAADPRADSRDEQLQPVLDPDGKRERELLVRYGLGPDTDPAAAAELIKSRPADVQRCLLGALYKCSAYAGSERPHDPHLFRWYSRVLDAIDPDPWRAAFRATLARDDRAALEKLARELEPHRHHPAVLLVAVGRTYRVTPAGAIELLRRAQAAHPNDLWLNSVLGFLLFHHKAPAQAVPFLTAALALRPHNPVLLLARGVAYRDAGKRDDALADAVAATKADPHHLLAHTLHADLLLARGDTVGGEAAARRALAINPNSPLANHLLGNARRDAKDPDGALVAYRTAIAANPKYVAAHTSVGLALLDKEDWDGAIAAFRTAARLDAKHVPARDELGTVLWVHKKDGPGAALAFLEALAIDPRHAEARAHLVRLFLATKAPEAAVAVAREGVERRPTSADARVDLGLALHEAGDPNAALDAFRMAVALDPNSAQAHSNLGTAYARKKDYRAAADSYRRAANLDPSNEKTWHNLGVTLSDLKEWDDAVTAFRTEVALTPKSAKAHHSLAVALTRKGDKEDAAVSFRDTGRLDPHYPSAWSNAGVAFYQIGRWRDARDAWAEAVKAFPNDYQCHSRLGLLSAVGPDPELHDPRAAADAGQKLIAAGQVGTGWVLVGWAEYRKDRWKEALAAVEKSLGPNAPADQITPLRGYLLAVAHAKLGNAAEARRWYDKAGAAKPDSLPEILARARAETAELLGIDPPPKR